MSIALVQTAKGNAGGYDTGISLAFGSNNTAGNLLVLFIAVGTDTGSNVSSITDTQGNTWTKIDDGAATYARGELWYAKNCGGGANTVTVNLTSNYHDPVVIMREYSGIDTTDPLDVSKEAIEGSYLQSHSTGASSATSQADELVVAAYAGDSNDAGNFSAGSGYGNLADQDGSDLYTTAAMQDKTVSSTGTQSATITSVAYMQGYVILATFKAAATNVPPTIALNTADETSTSDTTPTLEFTGSDTDDDDLRYQVQISDVSGVYAEAELDSYDIANSDSNVIMNSTNTYMKAQAFYGDGKKITKLRVWLKRTGSPTGTIYARIWNATGTIGTNAKPTGSELGSVALGTTAASISTSVTQYEFDLSSLDLTLTDSTVYCFNVEFGGGDGSNYITIARDTSSPTHEGNYSYSDDGISWSSSSTIDLCFEIDSEPATLIDAVSGTDAGFANTTDGGDTDPFDAGDKCSYTVQSALDAGTYYWRARVKDPSGSDTWSSWATEREFTVTTSVDATAYPSVDSVTVNDIAVSATGGASASLAAESVAVNDQAATASGSGVFGAAAEDVTVNDPAVAGFGTANVSLTAEEVTVNDPAVSAGISVTTGISEDVVTVADPSVMGTGTSSIGLAVEAVIVSAPAVTPTGDANVAAIVEELTVNDVAVTPYASVVSELSAEELTVNEGALTLTGDANTAVAAEDITVNDPDLTPSVPGIAQLVNDSVTVSDPAVAVTGGASVALPAETLTVTMLSVAVTADGLMVLGVETVTVNDPAVTPTLETDGTAYPAVDGVTVADPAYAWSADAVVTIVVESVTVNDDTATASGSGAFGAAAEELTVNEGAVSASGTYVPLVPELTYFSEGELADYRTPGSKRQQANGSFTSGGVPTADFRTAGRKTAAGNANFETPGQAHSFFSGR